LSGRESVKPGGTAGYYILSQHSGNVGQDFFMRLCGNAYQHPTTKAQKASRNVSQNTINAIQGKETEQ